MKESVVCLALASYFARQRSPAASGQQRKTSEQGRNDYGGEQSSGLTRKTWTALPLRQVRSEAYWLEMKADGGIEALVAKEASDSGQSSMIRI